MVPGDSREGGVEPITWTVPFGKQAAALPSGSSQTQTSQSVTPFNSTSASPVWFLVLRHVICFWVCPPHWEALGCPSLRAYLLSTPWTSFELTNGYSTQAMLLNLGC